MLLLPGVGTLARRGGLLVLLVAVGLAGAQFAYTQLSLLGRSALAVNVYGSEYSGTSTLSRLVQVTESQGIARVDGLGHVLLLPIDEDRRRATTTFNTVQLDALRIRAATATRQDGKLLLPLSTLAQGLGAQYVPGQFSLAPAVLSGVSSLSGRESDRIVFSLNRNVTVREELFGTSLRLTLVGASASTRNYTTRGAFAPRLQVTSEAGGARVTLPLPVGSGYRFYTVQDASGSRVVLDLGPGIPLTVPSLLAQLRKPLIVLDPAAVPGRSSDVTLEVARNAAEMLTKAGWQVRLTRDTASQAEVATRADLARQSDVFVSLDLGRFPGVNRSGVTLYEFAGQAQAQIISAYRQAQSAPLVSQVVSGASSSRTLSNLLRGELKSGGLTAAQQPESRLLLLGEAPKAALLLELGWPQSPSDQQRLADGARTTQMATALARAVATYLTAKANAGPVVRPLFSVFNVLGLVLLGLSALALRAVQEPPATPKAPRLVLAASPRAKVTLYFSDAKVQGYVKQSRDVSVTQNTPVALAQAALKSWAAGPAAPAQGAVGAVPRGSDVPTVWLRGDHFVVDLPSSYSELNYGVSGERMLLCSLTRTLLEQRGKDVLFLVGGKNADTLLGHADLHAPYAREDCANE